MTRIEQSVEVNVPVHTAYNQLTQFTDFPRFMEGVQEIRQLDDTHLHWHTKTDGEDHEWDAEITEQVPDKCIAWRNTSGHTNIGKVQLDPVASDKTRITMSMECEPEGPPAQLGKIKERIEQRTEQDLRRFKSFIESRGQETGEWRGEVHNAQVVTPDRSGRPESQSLAQAAAITQRETSAAPGEMQARPQEQPQVKRNMQAGAPQNAPESWLPKLMDVWEEPLVVMRRMTQEMDNLFERFLGRSASMSSWTGGARNWMPPVEVARRDNQLIICADLPGIKREDVHVEIRDDKLTIEGDRHAQAAPQQGEQEYRRTERPYGHFYRMIPLPEGVDSDAAAASMHDGVLEIRLPVAPPGRPGKRVDIRTQN